MPQNLGKSMKIYSIDQTADRKTNSLLNFGLNVPVKLAYKNDPVKAYKNDPLTKKLDVLGNQGRALVMKTPEDVNAIKEILSMNNSKITKVDAANLLPLYLKRKNLAQYLIKQTKQVGEDNLTVSRFDGVEVYNMLLSGKELDIKYISAIKDVHGKPRFNGYEIAEIAKVADDVQKLQYVEKLAKVKDSDGFYQYSGSQIVDMVKKFDTSDLRGQGRFH